MERSAVFIVPMMNRFSGRREPLLAVAVEQLDLGLAVLQQEVQLAEHLGDVGAVDLVDDQHERLARAFAGLVGDPLERARASPSATPRRRRRSRPGGSPRRSPRRCTSGGTAPAPDCASGQPAGLEQLLQRDTSCPCPGGPSRTTCRRSFRLSRSSRSQLSSAWWSSAARAATSQVRTGRLGPRLGLGAGSTGSGSGRCPARRRAARSRASTRSVRLTTSSPLNRSASAGCSQGGS